MLTVKTDALVNHGCFPLQTAQNWSHTSQCMLGVHNIGNWGPSTSGCINWHLIEYCFVLLLLHVFWPIWKCTSWVKFWWQHMQHCSALPRVCIVAVANLVAYSTNRQWVGLIWIRSLLAKVFLETWLSKVEMVQMTITKRSGKCWGIYSQLRVKMEQVTLNIHVLLKTNPTVGRCRLRWFPTVLRVVLL